MLCALEIYMYDKVNISRNVIADIIAIVVVRIR